MDLIIPAGTFSVPDLERANPKLSAIEVRVGLGEAIIKGQLEVVNEENGLPPEIPKYRKREV